MNNFLSLLKIIKLSVIAFSVFYFSSACVVYAATLTISPAINDLKVGSSVTVSVVVNSENTAINGADGTITFSPDILEVSYISKNNSIFPIWVEDPSYSNKNGIITFNGGIPNPGYTGSNGKVFSFILRAKKEGDATLNFSSSNVRANDGLGTNVLSKQESLQVTVASTKTPTKDIVDEQKNITPIAVADVPKIPRITSSVYPNQNEWYQTTTGTFFWSLEKNITKARLSVTKNSNGNTSVVYSPAISSKEIDNFSDGIWYFNAQLANDSGWSDTARYMVRVDTEKPEYCSVSKSSLVDDTTGVKAQLKIESRDVTSGIDHYTISVDGDKAIVWNNSNDNIYTTSVLNQGKHTVVVNAYDKAGNVCESKTEFDIESKITPPVVETYEDKVIVGDEITLQGKTYPNSQVEIIIEKEDGTIKTEMTRSNNEGVFSYATNPNLKKGVYTIYARVITDTGVRSLPSSMSTVEIVSELHKKDVAGSSDIVLIVLIIALTIAIVVICITVYKLYQIKATIRRETLIAEGKFHRAFNVLRDEIAIQLQAFEKVKNKRDLTKEEVKILKVLKLELTKAEELLNEEIEKINNKI